MHPSRPRLHVAVVAAILALSFAAGVEGPARSAPERTAPNRAPNRNAPNPSVLDPGRRTADDFPQREDAPTGFRVARLKYGGGGDWYSNPSSLPNLAKQLGARTTVPVRNFEEKKVSLLDERLFDYPFIYMNGHGTVRFTPEEVERLRSYLLSGGFLFADDNYGMDKSFRTEIKRVFPDKQLTEVPYDHPIYHCFYDLPHGPPKVHEHDGLPAQGLGIFNDGRLVVFYTYQSDIGDGIEDPHVHNDPPDIREQAMKMAINVVIYALTS